MVSEEKLNELRSKHKRIAVVPYGGDFDVVIRAPTRAEYKAWRAKKDQPEAQEDLIRLCVVYCNGKDASWQEAVAEFDRLLDTYPALGDSPHVSKIVGDFTGLVITESGKGSAPSSPSNGNAPAPSRTA